MTGPVSFDSITALITVVTPILVAVIGANDARHRKAADRARAAEQEARNAQEALAKKIKLEETTRMNDLIKTVTAIAEQLKCMQKCDEQQQERITSSEKTTRLSGLYVHELAQLVTVLAEGVRDQHLDGNITRAISDFRSFESSTLNHLISGDTGLSESCK